MRRVCDNGVAECGGHAQGVVDVSTASLRMVRTSYFIEICVNSSRSSVSMMACTGVPKHADAEALEALRCGAARRPQFRAVSVRRKRAVSRRGVLFDDTFDEIWRYRQEVYLVGKSVGGLHGGDVGVDQDSGDAFFLEGFEGLARRSSRIARLRRFLARRCPKAALSVVFSFILCCGVRKVLKK